MHAEHARQELMHNLTIRISSLRACSAQASVFLFFKFQKHAEHTHQELMRTLSIQVKNRFVCSAYCERKNSKFEKIPSKHADHAHKELMHALSMRVRN